MWRQPLASTTGVTVYGELGSAALSALKLVPSCMFDRHSILNGPNGTYTPYAACRACRPDHGPKATGSAV